MRAGRRYVLWALVFAALGVLGWLIMFWTRASAQDGCVVRVVPGGIVLQGCRVLTPTATRTPVRTPTATRTATAQPTSTSTSTATPPPATAARLALGPGWAGDVDGYYSDGARLHVDGGGAILWQERFGAAQEVYVTLAAIDRTSTGLALLLLSESAGSPHPSALGVRFDPRRDTLQPIHTLAGGWHMMGAPASVTFDEGDQFGVRFDTGVLTAWRNGAQVGAWYIEPVWFAPAAEGYVGLATDASPGWAFDDFGGGTLP